MFSILFFYIIGWILHSASAAVPESQLTVVMQSLASNKLNSISDKYEIFKGGSDKKLRPCSY
jgi:hypothetical protein